MSRGACLCGAVQYEIAGPFQTMLSCHCSICRKHHGALFATFVSAPFERLRFLAGEEHVARYASSPSFDRPFCRRCGSPVATPAPGIGLSFAPAGALEGDLGIRPQGHIFAGSKASWYAITDGLPQHDEYPATFRKVRAVPGPAPEPHEDGVVGGACLCGAVAFEFTGRPSRIMNCHCSRCRRSRGAAHATNVFVPAEQFRWLRGQEGIRRFKVAEAERFAVSFCTRCGGKAPTVHGPASFVAIPGGALEADPGARPQGHIFVADKAPWFAITDDVPQFAAYPPAH